MSQPGSTRERLVELQLDGRYRITQRVQHLGEGDLYLACDDRAEDQVLVKLFHEHLLLDDTFEERFPAEMERLVALEHERLAGVIEWGLGEGMPYAVFAHRSGGLLADQLDANHGRLPPEKILKWLPGVALGLDFVHGEGLLHRSVHPWSVVFDEFGNAAVTGFGAVRVVGRDPAYVELVRRGRIGCAPEYVAPEALDGSDLSPAHDQYALAVVVYRQVSGRYPYACEDPLEAFEKDLSPTPLHEVAPHLPEASADAVMRALERDPSRRFASCTELAEAFRKEVEPNAPPFVKSVPQARAAMQRAVDAIATAVIEPEPDFEYEAAEEEEDEEPPNRRSRLKIAAVVALLLCGYFGYDAFLVPKTVLTKTVTKRAPPLEMEADAVVRDATVVVEGTTQPGVQLVVSGREVDVGGDGRFHVAIELAGEGPNPIVATARLQGGKTARVERVVTLDTRAPGITLTEPAAPVVTTGDAVVVRGRVDDPTALVTIGGAEVAVADDGAFAFECPLAEDGAFELVVEARDGAGNESRETVPVRRDTVPPSLEILEPLSPFATSTGEMRVVGQAEDGVVTVAGRDVPVEDGRFEATVELPNAGPQTIEVRVRDEAGNERSRILKVVQEATLVVSAPEPGFVTREASVLVRGRSYLPGPVTVAGEKVEPGPDGRFERTVALEEGTRPVTVRAGEAEITRPVTRDTTAPRLTYPGLAIAASPNSVVSVRGTVHDTSDCVVTVNGRPARVRGREFDLTLVLPVATDRLRIEAVDGAGNRSEIERPVHMRRPRFAGLAFRDRTEEGLWQYSLADDPEVVLVLVPEGFLPDGRRVAPFLVARDETAVPAAELDDYCARTGLRLATAAELARCGLDGVRLARSAD